MLGAVLYLRVSSKEQVDNYSLSTQERLCREFCARSGWDVVEVFSEPGESAKTDARPELQRMLAFLGRQRGAARQVTAVVVLDLKRFARNQVDHFALRARLIRAGVQLRSVMEPSVGDETAASVIVEGVMAAVAHGDNIERSSKTKEGMKAVLLAGGWPWRAPRGYKNTPGNNVEFDERTAPLVRLAFDRAAHGTSVPAIVEELARHGVSIARVTLHSMLRNPFYAGRVVSHTMGIDLRGRHTPMVSARTFVNVQRRGQRGSSGVAEHHGPRPYRTGSTAQYPLRAICRCADCATGLTAYRTKRWHYYRCPNCNGNVSAQHLEQSFLSYLDSLAVPSPVLDLFEAIVLERQEEAARRHQELAEANRRRVDTTKKRLERLRNAYLYDQAIDLDTFKAEQQRLRIELLEAETAASPANPTRQIQLRLASVRQYLQTPLLLWDSTHKDTRPKLVQTLFPAGLDYHQRGKNLTAPKSLLFVALRGQEMARSSAWYPEADEPPTPESLPELAWLSNLETAIAQCLEAHP